MATQSPEKPRHIDERITSIGAPELVDAFEHPEYVDSIAGLRSWLSEAQRPAAWPLDSWARAFAGSEQAATVLAAARNLLESPVDVTGAEYGRSRRYGFHYLRWLEPLAQAYALTGKERFVTRFEELFDEWCARRDEVTGEWPGLDPIWYSLGTWARSVHLLPALDVMGPSLSDRTWTQVMGTLVGGARWAYDEHDVFRYGNWQLAAATQLVHMSAVYPQLSESGDWGRRGEQRLHDHLELDFYPDGGHHERSPGYHLMCAECLQTAAYVDLAYRDGQLISHPKMAELHRWLGEMTADGGWVPAFQDSGLIWSGPALLTGAYLLLDTELLALARKNLPPAQYDRLMRALPTVERAEHQRRWLQLLEEEIEQGPQRALSLLPYSGYAILRSRCGFSAYVNAGPHVDHELESHSHRAALDLVVTGWGHALLWEAGGPPSYDDPQYQSWFQSGLGHNTVTVDGRELGPDREVDVNLAWNSEWLSVFAGRMRGDGLEHERTVVLVDLEVPFLLVFDAVRELNEVGAPTGRAPEAHRFDLRWHSPSPWSEEKSGRWVTNSPGIAAILDAPQVASTSAPAQARVPDSATREAPYQDLHTLVASKTEGVFTTLLHPYQDRSGSADALRAASPTQVTTSTGAHYLLSANSVVGLGSGGEVERAALWNTTRLVHDERVVINASTPVHGWWQRQGRHWQAQLTTSGRCRVSLPGRVEQINGIAVQLGEEPVTLTYAGTWKLSGLANV